MSKVQLSTKEYELVNDAGWFLTKQAIIDKVYLLFGEIYEEQLKITAETMLGEKIISPQAKISRGENYLGLPYVILDYPRLFGTKDIFAIRIMFWWANYFSITLHLKGKYKESFAAHLPGNVQTSIPASFSICTGDDEWAHQVSPDNYRQLSELNFDQLQEIVNSRSFLKIAGKVPLTEWDNAFSQLLKMYREILNLIRY